ncbi:hypothetical protein L9F63_007986, partial [Diploptera punctata]
RFALNCGGHLQWRVLLGVFPVVGAGIFAIKKTSNRIISQYQNVAVQLLSLKDGKWNHQAVVYLMERLYRRDSVLRASFVKTGCTTRSKKKKQKKKQKQKKQKSKKKSKKSKKSKTKKQKKQKKKSK